MLVYQRGKSHQTTIFLGFSYGFSTIGRCSFEPMEFTMRQASTGAKAVSPTGAVFCAGVHNGWDRPIWYLDYLDNPTSKVCRGY